MARNVLAIQRRDFFSSVMIAILAAILFPVFAKAREKARTASCQSNMKQLMLGVLMYAQDYDEVLPNHEQYAGTPRLSWWGMIYPYVKSTQVFICPSNTSSDTFKSWDTVNTDRCLGAHYGIPRIHSSTPLRAPLSDIASVSETIFIGETWADGGCDDFEMGPIGVPHGFVRTDAASRLHSEGSNYAFCDGHVKWLRPTGVRCIDDTTPGNCFWSKN